MKCPFHNIDLQFQGDYSYCIFNVRNEVHVTHSARDRSIRVVMEYGNFQFSIDGDKITCVVFFDEDSGEKVWINDSFEIPTKDSIIVNSRTINDIPRIIEKFEIAKTFK